MALKLSVIIAIMLLVPAYAVNSADRVGCSETWGHLVDWTYDSPTSKTVLRYRVYLPPCYYTSHKRYPYVILMSGNDGDETEWTERLNADTDADMEISRDILPPMILVMPDGGPLMNVNAFQPLRSWETVVTDELMPAVEGTFCVQHTRAGRAIGGISRGGFWAFEIGLRHPELFSAIGGHSPVFGQTNISPTVDPMALAFTVEPPLPWRLWIDMGSKDPSLGPVRKIQQTLKDRGFDVTYKVSAGGDHSDNYWSSYLGDYLQFYSLKWTKNVAELPDC